MPSKPAPLAIRIRAGNSQRVAREQREELCSGMWRRPAALAVVLLLSSSVSPLSTFSAPLSRPAPQDGGGVQAAKAERQQDHSGEQVDDNTPLQGTVVDADGIPVPNVSVVMSNPQDRLEMTQDFQVRGGWRAEADQFGHFQFRRRSIPGLVVVVDDRGYAEMTVTDLAKTGKIRLEAWAQIKVRVLRGDQPLEGGKIVVRSKRASAIRYEQGFGIERTSDSSGIAAFNRVIPGRVSVGLLIERKTQRGKITSRERFKEIEAEPGETKWAVLGGTGQPVSGRLTVMGKAPVAHSWETNDWLYISGERGSPAQPGRYFVGLIQADGSFRVDDIPSGKYVLQVHLTAESEEGTGERLGTIRTTFEVQGDEPVDLGVIEGAWDPLLSVGDPMPRFVIAGIDDKPIRSEDLRGQIVLMQFWARWSKSSLQQIDALASLPRALGADKRLRVLVLSLDPTFEEAAMEAQKHAWPWTIGYAGRTFDCMVPKRFDLKTVTDKFVFDVDGMLLYRGDDLQQIEELITKRLATLPTIVPIADVSPGVQAVPVDDSFRTGRMPAVAMAMSNINYAGGKPTLTGPGLVLWTNRGREIRSLGGIGTSGWFTGPRRITFDTGRRRTYFCDTANNRLLALDKNGRQLFVTPIDYLHAAAVDQKTGDIWCMACGLLNDGELLVLGPEGCEKTRFPSAAFDLAFSRADDAFWLAGKSIVKMTRDGRVVRGKSLGVDAFSFGSIAVDEVQGGAWVLELQSDHLPGSGPRVWRVTSEAVATVAHEFRPEVSVRSLAIALNKLWVATWAPDPDADNPDRPYSGKVSRFNLQGDLEAELDLEATNIAASADGDDLWICAEGKLQRIDVAGKVLQTIEMPQGVTRGQLLVY